MFSNIEALTKDKHQDLRYNAVNGYGFAANISSAPLSVSEFIMASKYYPVVFIKDQPTPVALLSLDRDKNNFVNDDGSWKVPYIPAHFRRYPFIFAKTPAATDAEKEGYVMCIDRDAPHFASPQGELMFTANGEPTQFTLKAVEFLKKYQEEMVMTSNFVKVLEEKDVFVERQFDIVRNGQKKSLAGIRVVDMEKLNALDDATLADWVRKGIMALVFAHASSLSNLKM